MIKFTSTYDTLEVEFDSGDKILFNQGDGFVPRLHKVSIILMTPLSEDGNIEINTFPILWNGLSISTARLLYALLAAWKQQTAVIPLLTKIADFTFVVPAGYFLDTIIGDNSTAFTAQLDIGLTSGGAEIAHTFGWTANSVTNAVIERMFSATLPTTIYIDDNEIGGGGNWNGATINFYAVMKKVI